ncbi:1-phosphatidylinositol 4,5-bisphosphate phosphodiesterase 1 [Sphaceloma murrayae]|uniref:1-phosphatidylinositol 4,5-bisphosphate phosphodiesterase 1 n=1 Tax=Sphaceloma murrayae TaxID=2082308 RepID=A0A2K1QXJ5_9PEZI|nr:1-phosphatidylinositol 4,5-bisphosphate phosphodiesterase 1 [Sphaceloma murrayae]
MAEQSQPDRPLTQYSDVNHQPPLWVASIFCPIAAILFLGIRFYARSKNFKPETLWNIGVFVVASAHWACIYAALARGAGKDVSVISETAYFDAGRLIFASRILLLVLEGLSRAFFLHFLRQIFHVRSSRGRSVWDWSNQQGYFKIYTAALLVHIVFVIGAPIIVAAGCNAEQALAGREPGYCANDSARWITVTALTGVSELLPLLLAILSVRTLETTLRRKIDICIVLGSCRLIPLVISTLYLSSYLSFIRSGRSSIDATPFLIYQQILVATSALSLCVPVLRNFGSNFNNGGLGGILDGTGAVTAPSKSSPEVTGPTGAGAGAGTGTGLSLMRLRSIVMGGSSNRGSPPTSHGTSRTGPSGRSFGSGLRSFADDPDKSADIGKLGQPGESEVWVSSEARKGPGSRFRSAGHGGGERVEDEVELVGRGAGIGVGGVPGVGGGGGGGGGVASRPESEGTDSEGLGLGSGGTQQIITEDGKVIVRRKEYEVRRT